MAVTFLFATMGFCMMLWFGYMMWQARRRPGQRVPGQETRSALTELARRVGAADRWLERI